MRHVFALLLCLNLTPAMAQDEGTPEDIDNGVEMLSEGVRTLLRGLMGEVEPAMRDMARALEEWDFNGLGPEDLGQYHPPEILPNGDIIIRRKEPRDTPMDDEIEL